MTNTYTLLYVIHDFINKNAGDPELFDILGESEMEDIFERIDFAPPPALVNKIIYENL